MTNEEIFEKGRAMGIFHTTEPCADGESFFFRVVFYKQLPKEALGFTSIRVHKPSEEAKHPAAAPHEGWDYDTFHEAEDFAADMINKTIEKKEAGSSLAIEKGYNL